MYFCKANKLHFFIAICLLQSINSFTQISEGNIPIRNYPYTEYNAHQENTAIVQGKRGVIYIGNNHGILEYDGFEWRLIPTQNRTSVLSLSIDSNGVIYAGAQGEFGYLMPDSVGKLNFHSLSSKLDEEDRDFVPVFETFATKDGVWFRTPSKIFKWNGDKFKIWNAEAVFHVMFHLPQRGGIYVRQWEVGLMRIVNDSLVLVHGGEQFDFVKIYGMFPYNLPALKLRQAGLPAEASVQAGENHILIVTNGNGLFTMRYYPNYLPKQAVGILPFPVTADNILKDSDVYYSLQISENKYSIGTKDIGTILINAEGEIIKIVNKKTGVQSDFIANQYLDTQNNLWLTLNKGIAKVEINSPISFFAESEGVEGEILSITLYNNRLFLATSKGVYFEKNPESNKFPGSSFRFIKVKGIDSECWDLLPLYNLIPKDTTLLVATSHGIYEITDAHIPALLSDYKPSVLHRSKSDASKIFVGTPDGLVELYRTGSRWEDIGIIENIDLDIRSIIEIEAGRIWAGTIGDGVFYFEYSGEGAGKIIHFDTAAGLPEGGVNVNRVKGKIYFGTEKGVYKFVKEKEKFVPDSTFGVQFSEGNRYIHRISEDPNGNVWINTFSGNKFEIGVSKYLDNSHYQYEAAKYIRIPQEIYHAIYHDKDSATWLGGENGMVRYDHKTEYKYELFFPPVIRKVLIGKDSVIFWGCYYQPSENRDYYTRLVSEVQPEKLRPILPFKFNSISFDFSLPDYANEKANEYKYFLEGFDTDWSNWKSITHAIYTNLHAGSYKFRLKARNVYKSESKETTYEFTITPPFYNTIWFYAGQILFILMLFAVAFYYGRTGRSIRIATILATVAIFIVFEYLQTFAEENLGAKLGSIIFIKVLLNVLLAFILLPVEKYLKYFITAERERRKVRKRGKSIKKTSKKKGGKKEGKKK